MITANEAKETADVKNSFESEQEGINDAIKTAADTGQYSVMAFTVNSVEMIKNYQELGFTVERKERFDGQGPGEAYEISWK